MQRGDVSSDRAARSLADRPVKFRCQFRVELEKLSDGILPVTEADVKATVLHLPRALAAECLYVVLLSIWKKLCLTYGYEEHL